MTEEMHGSEEHEYLLGTDAEELARLGFQHQVWAEQTARAWQHAAFGRGDTLLDVGCGPGYAAFDLAHLVGPSGSVIATDISRRFITHLRAQAEARGVRNIRADLRDVERLELPEASVNGAFARWVLCFSADPEAVVRGVARALRPGGRFAILDYARYEAFTLAPASDAFRRIIDATGESFRVRGGNPEIGQALPGILQRCGLEVTRLEPVVRVARPGSALWKWPETFFDNYLSTLVEMELISTADSAAFRQDWQERSADPAAYFFTPMMIEIIATKR